MADTDDMTEEDKAMHHFESARVETPPSDYVSPFTPEGAALNKSRYDFSPEELAAVQAMRLDYPQHDLTDEALASTDFYEEQEIYGEKQRVNEGRIGNHPRFIGKLVGMARRLGYLGDN